MDGNDNNPNYILKKVILDTLTAFVIGDHNCFL